MSTAWRGWPLLLVVVVGCHSDPPAEHLGAYRLEDGRVLSIRRSPDHTLRYREYASGRSQRLYPIDESQYVAGPGFSDREPVRLRLTFQDEGRRLRWRRLDELELTGQRIGRDRWIRFDSDGTRLEGRLHLPDGPGPFPAVVLVHGSGHQPGSEWLFDGDFFAAHGVAALSFDKRGTGRSGGEFTFDFRQLARDVSAAVDRLTRVVEICSDGIGVAGYSQGGWVAPLAASMNSHIGFVLVSYGMIESPAEEARLEMLDRVRSAGADEDAQSAADSLVRAAIEVVSSDFETGWEDYEALRERHREADWWSALRGTPVEQLGRWPRWITRWVGPRRTPEGLPWHYASTTVLDSLECPMVWFLGREDRSAPNAATIEKLRGYAEAGRPYRLHIFEDADHVMLTFEEQNGERRYTGYSPGYFPAEVAAARRLSRRACAR